MITTIFAIVVIAMIVAFSLYMADEVHNYMENDNNQEGLVVFE